VDTSVDPLWSAIRHSCWCFSPKCRLPPGCNFSCSFRLLFSCNFLLPTVSLSPSLFCLVHVYAARPLSFSSALTLSGNSFQLSTALTAKEFFLVSVLANCFKRHLSPAALLVLASVNSPCLSLITYLCAKAMSCRSRLLFREWVIGVCHGSGSESTWIRIKLSSKSRSM